MKTIDPDNEAKLTFSVCDATEEVTDLLIDSKRGHGLIKCNPDLVQSYDVLKGAPIGLKDRFYQRVLSRNNSRSQSLPSSLENNKCTPDLDVQDSCDTKLLADHEAPPSPQSPTSELWFKTWPEKKCDKLKSECSPDSEVTNGNKMSLNDALQNISIAYSPVTKQLVLVEKVEPQQAEVESVCDLKKLGHRRNEPGSFSSTISSLSDPSPSGSLLDPEDQTTTELYDPKCKRKGITGFFNRNVFSWKSTANSTSSSPVGVWKLFNKSPVDTQAQNSPQHEVVIASSSALIQYNRPSNLPAKALEEEQRHREEYKAMLAAAKRKEAQSSAAKQKQQKIQLKLEEQQATAAKHFTQQVLPKWDSMFNTKKTRDLWWQGLPSSVRGKVWRLAIGNELNLTQQLYEICLSRAQNRLSSPEPSHCDSDIDQESSMDVIQLDIARTFPNLCIFQEGGPYSDVLHSLLAAYVCYRPDVGYVQGMSYIAAILILNMEPFDAFVCFANLLNQHLHIAAFTLNQTQMQAYYNAYNEVFSHNLPKLCSHFEEANLTPDLYLLDWIYTVFAKAMPLDIACRVWDLFLRDGDEFIFRTALGILHLNQEILITMDFLHGAQFLTRLPDDLSAEQLFKSIQAVSTNIGKQTFGQIVERCKLTVPEEAQL